MRHRSVVVLGALVVASLLAAGMGAPVTSQAPSVPPAAATDVSCRTEGPADDADPVVPAPSLDPALAPDAVPVQVAPNRPGGRLPGRWTVESRVSLPPRRDAIVLTKYGVVVWGGVDRDGQPLNDGFEVRPSGAWRALPPAPICARTDFAWAGDRAGNLVIWGGLDAEGRPLSDGAVYSVGLRQWTLLNPGPLPPGPATMAGDLNDLRVVTADPVTGGPIMTTLHRQVIEAGSWSNVFALPLPVGVRYEVVSCCSTPGSSGERWVIVLSVGSDGFATALRYAYVLGPGRWEPLGRVPVGPGATGGPVQGLTTGRELTGWIRTTADPYPGSDRAGLVGVLMDTERPFAAWQLTGSAPIGTIDDPSLVLSPRYLVSIKGGVAWDLLDGRWRRLAGTRRGAGVLGVTAWWADGRLWTYGGRSPNGRLDPRLRSFTPRLPWRTVDRPGPPTRGGGEACYVYVQEGPGTWRLRGDPDDPWVAWAQFGTRRVRMAWPDGWVARFRPRLAIVDPTGTVVGREGDRCRRDAGSGG